MATNSNTQYIEPLIINVPLEELKTKLEKLLQEAESHRADYNSRLPEAIKASGESFGYWKGRRDEAGHFRDRLAAILGK